MPDSKFKQYWNLFITVLLIFTAVYVPFKTAFVDDTSTGILIMETFVDCAFIIDLFTQFFSAYENKNVGVETRWSRIVCNYLKGWFIIDIMSSIPIQLLEIE